MPSQHRAGRRLFVVTRSAPYWRWAAPVLVGLGAAALMTIRLGHRSYWVDEAYNVVFVRERWPSLVRAIGDHEPSQALYVVLLKPWIALVGESEWLVRAPSVVFGAAAAALSVVLATRLFDRTVGVLAGVLLASNAALVEWSQYARTYSLAVFAAVGTTLLFVIASEREWERERGRGIWVVYGVVAAVSVYCHLYVGFVLLCHVVAAVSRDGRRALRYLIPAWAVIAVGLIPLGFYFQRGTRSPVDWIPEPDLRVIWRSLDFVSGFNHVLLAAAAVGAVVAAKRAARWPSVLLVSWAVIPLVCGLLVSIVHPALVPRFLLVVAPALAILAAVAVARLPRAGIAVALGILLTVSAVRVWAVYDRPGHDWEDAARLARAGYEQGLDVGIVPRFAWRELAVYAPGVGRIERPRGRPFVLVVGASNPGYARALTRSFLGEGGYRLVSDERVGGVRVQRWQPAGS